MTYSQHLSTSSDLITTREKIRAGFVALALEKNRIATPIIAQARALKASAMQARKASDLIKASRLKPLLLAAAGVSNKAAGHMLEDDKTETITRFIRNFLEPAGANFVEELVYRFLLTRGDTLGGSVRNIGGALAQKKFTEMITLALNATKVSYIFLTKRNKVLCTSDSDSESALADVKAISWFHDKLNRTIVYNATVPIVRKNIDICVLDCSYRELAVSSKIAGKYLALGELKGGIDPAGADEHWKTANTALSRIRTGFAQENIYPHLFFVGAVIVSDMATEIWSQLETGSLKNAANLTRANQVESLCRWLCSL